MAVDGKGGGMKLRGVEAARGVAALLVVLRHATTILSGSDPHQAFGGFFIFGRAGVEFFFVLSGFIITYVHAQDAGRPQMLGAFCSKRVNRIYPPYWVATAILGAILVLSPTRERTEQDPLHILLSLFLLPESIEPILGVGWSLRHEMLFYALFAVVIWRRALGIGVLALWGACLIANMAVTTVTDHTTFSGAIGVLVFRGFNLQFLLGVGVALLVRRGRSWRPAVILAAGAMAFFCIGMTESFGAEIPTEWPPRVLGYGLASAAILYGVAQLDLAQAIRVPLLLSVMGRASYSIYLMHVTVLMLLQFALRLVRPHVAIPVEISFVLCVVVAVTAGVAFSRVVEYPALRLGRRVLRSA